MADKQYIHDRVAVFCDGCWIWLQSVDKDGYGKAAEFRKSIRAHRLSYKLFRDQIPKGKQLDHVVCDEPMCCNPWHVELSTARENTMRSLAAPAAINSRKTHCSKGHEFTPENTRYEKKGRNTGRYERKCKKCQAIKMAAYYQNVLKPKRRLG